MSFNWNKTFDNLLFYGFDVVSTAGKSHILKFARRDIGNPKGPISFRFDCDLRRLL